MDDPAPNAELLRSLGRLARGLSALFWGLPADADHLRGNRPRRLAQAARHRFPRSPPPACCSTASGRWAISKNRSVPGATPSTARKLLGLVNFGLCPFLYWQNKMPEQLFFNAAVFVLVLSAMLFLFNLNVVLKQLGAMLPDETLRQETRQFTVLNRWLLVALLFLRRRRTSPCSTIRACPPHSANLFVWLNRLGFWVLTFFALLPLAMTMALIWKTKEIILDSVFGCGSESCETKKQARLISISPRFVLRYFDVQVRSFDLNFHFK